MTKLEEELKAVLTPNSDRQGLPMRLHDGSVVDIACSDSSFHDRCVKLSAEVALKWIDKAFDAGLRGIPYKTFAAEGVADNIQGLVDFIKKQWLKDNGLI